MLNRIRQGEFTDGLLPPEAELIRHYRVGRITAYNAVKELVKDGHVVRVQGKGTFVNDGSYIPGATGARARQVALITQVQGHYHGELRDALSLALLRRGLYPVGFSLVSFGVEPAAAANVEVLLKSDIKGVIASGGGYWKNRFLDQHNHIPRVFIDNFDADGHPPGGKAVLVDYEQGFYNATQHLWRMGRQRVVLVNHPNKVTVDITPSHRRNHPRCQARDGYQRAMQEAGRESAAMVFDLPDDRKQHRQMIGQLLDESPDAIVCGEDFYAVRIMLQALKRGLRIPEDLALIGCYNTPWSDEAPVPLSSLSPQPELLAERAALSILDAKTEGTEKITPKLILRESCDV